MAKPELGVKRSCLSCAAKFYDLGKDPIVCPSCGADFDPEAAMKLKRGRVAPANDDKPKKDDEGKKSEDGDDLDVDDDDIDLEDDEDDGVLEDTSDLEDDEDVPAVVKTGDADDT